LSSFRFLSPIKGGGRGRVRRSYLSGGGKRGFLKEEEEAERGAPAGGHQRLGVMVFKKRRKGKRRQPALWEAVYRVGILSSLEKGEGGKEKRER